MKDILKDDSPRELLVAPAPTKAEQRGASRAWSYEVPLFYLGLFLLQRLAFPERPGFYDLNPSPYWLGILLFGLRYGLGAGLASGILSAALYSLGLKSAGFGYRLQDSEFLVRAGLFIVTGGGVGGTTAGLLSRSEDLKSRIADLMQRIKGLQSQILAQQQAQRAVEQQVVSQMSSIVTLYHGSRTLGALDRQELMKAILEFFSKALQAEKSSLYIPKDGAWELHSSRGWQPGDRYSSRIPAGLGLVGRAGSERTVLSLRDFFAAQEEGGDSASAQGEADALMAAPLKAPDGRVLAVYSVQAMPFLQFNSASINLLSLLAEWGDEALAKCLHFEDLHSRSILDEDFGVYSANYFTNRTRQEFSRSSRYALPLSLMLLSPEGLEKATAAKQVAYLHALSTILKDATRDSDVVTKSPFEGAPFAVILVTTSKEQALLVKERILESSRKLGLPYPLRVGVGSFAHKMKCIDEIYEEARTAIG